MTMSPPVQNSMRQTATVSRTLPGPLDPLGNPSAGVKTTRMIPCRAWEATETQISGDGKRYSVTVLKTRVAPDADIQHADRLTVDGIGGEVDRVVTRRDHKVVIVEVYH